MPNNHLSRFVLRLGRCALAGLWLLPLAVYAEETKPASSSEKDAIRTSVRSYVAAYNRGDAKAVANHWSDQGQWVSATGEKYAGKPAIERALKALFEENEGSTIEVSEPTIRLVSPDVAIEEGTVVMLSREALPTESTYLAVHVKKDGEWKLDSVRETEIPDSPARAAELQQLTWLVGEWVDDDPQGSNEIKVAWTKNKTFLTYSFKLSVAGLDDLEGTQVIGWDPAAGTIRSWMFDSDGGFGEGVWSRKGDSWVVKFNQVLPVGGRASATNVYKQIDANAFTWKSIGRDVEGELQPNVEEVNIVRKGALQPAASASGETVATSPSDTTPEDSSTDSEKPRQSDEQKE